MLIYAGIDEAGYGPMLGPLVVGCTVFVLPEHDPDAGAPKMWSMLRSAVARDLKSAKGRIVVNDSKKLKLPNENLNRANAKHPLLHLERGVLSFLHQVEGGEGAPGDDGEYVRRVVCNRKRQFEELRWYLGETTALPLANDAATLRIAGNSLDRAMTRHAVQLASISCRVLCEPAFNAIVNRVKSKAAANFMVIGRHLAEIFDSFGREHPRVIVDRQSGRIRYRESLHDLFPEAELRIIAEEDGVSRYHFRDGGREMTITFTKDAEEKHMPVALSSMTAKYTRELFMMRFNRFFQQHLPELRPTAGYVTDARRFLEEVEPVVRRIGIDREALVRKC